MFFFGVKKERKNLWGDPSPKPWRPWRSGARGQLGLRIKRGFVNFGTKPFFFLFLSSREHKHKTVSSASEFENERSQTLDTLLLFTQFGNQEELRQRMP